MHNQGAAIQTKLKCAPTWAGIMGFGMLLDTFLEAALCFLDTLLIFDRQALF